MMYTMEQWRADRQLKLSPGMIVSDEVVDVLINSVPPKTYNNGVFQPGEAASIGTKFELIYDTYIREAEGWRYIGRCYLGETEVAEEFIVQ